MRIITAAAAVLSCLFSFSALAVDLERKVDFDIPV